MRDILPKMDIFLQEIRCINFVVLEGNMCLSCGNIQKKIVKCKNITKMPKYVDSMYSFAIIKLNLIFKKGVLKNERKKIGASQMDGNGNGGDNVVFRCSGCSVSGRAG